MTCHPINVLLGLGFCALGTILVLYPAIIALTAMAKTW